MTETPTLPHGSLDGVAALVTGASSGIGAAVATTLDSLGARVAVSGRDTARLDNLVRILHNDPVVLPSDLGTRGAASALAFAAIEALGTVTALINNAGMGTPGEVTEESIDRLFAVNVRAPLLLTSVLAPHMADNSGGSIVSLSSVLGRVGTRGAMLYSATKGAITSATRSVAADWGHRGVRANVVSPGIVDTPMGSFVTSNAQILERYNGQVPLQRVAQVDDVAQLVAFLLSPAARYITGEDIAVDGGWSRTKVSGK